jgi:putative transposase
MKKRRFSEEQILGYLKAAEAGTPIHELCRKHGFSHASFYTWRKKYGGMSVNEAKRLRELEAENGKLKKLLAESLLNTEALRTALSRKY